MLISKLKSSVLTAFAILIVTTLAGWHFVAVAQDAPRVATEPARPAPAKKDASHFVIELEFSQPNLSRAIAAHPKGMPSATAAQMKMAVVAGEMGRGWLRGPVTQVTGDGRDILGPRVRARVVPAKKTGWVQVEAILEEVTLHEKDDQPKLTVERLGYVKTDLPLRKDLVFPRGTGNEANPSNVQITRIMVSPLVISPEGESGETGAIVPSPAIVPTAYASTPVARQTPANPAIAARTDPKIYRINIQAMEGKETLAMPQISAIEGQEWTVQIGGELIVPESSPLQLLPIGLRISGVVSRAENGKIQVRIDAQRTKKKTEGNAKELVGTESQGMQAAYAATLGDPVQFRLTTNGPRLVVTVAEQKDGQRK